MMWNETLIGMQTYNKQTVQQIPIILSFLRGISLYSGTKKNEAYNVYSVIEWKVDSGWGLYDTKGFENYPAMKICLIMTPHCG